MLPFLHNAEVGRERQRKQLGLLRSLNDHERTRSGPDPKLDARIRSMETAFRMQFAANEAFDLNLEPKSIREEYGNSHFANGCLLARRLAERGVRFTQVYYGDGQPRGYAQQTQRRGPPARRGHRPSDCSSARRSQSLRYAWTHTGCRGAKENLPFG